MPDEKGTSRVQFQVLGPLRVRGEGSIDLDRPSHRRLLSILILDAGRRMSTDVLIDRFWPDRPPATAKAALQTHVSALRKILGRGVILTEGDGYRLNADPTDVDASVFQQLASESRTAADDRNWGSALSVADEALDLWRGRPFADLQDDHFAQPAITRFEELNLEFLEMRAESLLALDRPGDVLADLEGLVVEHPLREGLWEHLMTARFRSGRHTEALRAYQDVSDHLAEIGLEPGERLRRLEERILLQDRTLAQTRHNLPVELSSFIGREDEILQTTRLLSDHRLVTLTGAGGSGKTRLAIQVARELLDHFPDGVWLVELAAAQGPSQVPTEVAKSMGLQPQGEDVVDVLAATTAAAKTLIILDNCEHIRAGAAVTAQRLLQSSPFLRILATSREPLRVPGESIREISGMRFPGDGPSDLTGALEYEAIRLFEQRATQASASFKVDELNLRDVASICERLDGMPLAIELAAARIRSLPVATIADRLDDHLQLLTGGSLTAPPRQQTLQATIEWSYRLLDHMERAVLNRLSIFRGGFRLDAAEQVVSGAGIAEESVTPVIADLVDKSLITTYETRFGSRYRLLETVRQYADQRFRETTHAATIRGQQQRWCLSLVGDMWQRALGGGQIGLSRELELEADNLQAALEWSTSIGDGEAVVAFSQALGWYWYFTGHLSIATATLRGGLAEANEERDVALIRSLLARCFAFSEDIAAAISEAESAHRLLATLGTPLERTWVIATVHLSHFMSVESDPDSSLRLAAEAADAALGKGDIYAETLARQIMADAYCWNGRVEEGLEQQRIALDRAVASGDPMTINQIYGLSIYNYMLDPLARRTEPLRVTEEWVSLGLLDVETWASTATDWLPWVYMQVGDFDRASEAAARMGNRTLEGYNRTIHLMVRSSLSWMKGELREAMQGVEELKARAVSPRWAHTYYPLAAEIATDLGHLDEVRTIANTYLAMKVHPTGEAAKLGVLNPLVRVEVDAAVDTGSKDHLARAHEALSQMRRILEDHPPRVDSWTSLMTHTQNLAFAEAEMTRATGPSPQHWSDAVAAADYIYYQLYARWRLAEALLQVGETGDGAIELKAVHLDGARIGAQLLRTRAEATGRDFDIRLD